MERSRDAVTRLEQQLAGLRRQRDQATRRPDLMLEALLDSDNLSPVLRAKARQLQAQVCELDERIAETE